MADQVMSKRPNFEDKTWIDDQVMQAEEYVTDLEYELSRYKHATQRLHNALGKVVYWNKRGLPKRMLDLADTELELFRCCTGCRTMDSDKWRKGMNTGHWFCSSKCATGYGVAT